MDGKARTCGRVTGVGLHAFDVAMSPSDTEPGWHVEVPLAALTDRERREVAVGGGVGWVRDERGTRLALTTPAPAAAERTCLDWVEHMA